MKCSEICEVSFNKLMETNLFSELLDVVTILDEYTYILSATQYEYNVVLSVRIIQS